MAREIDLEPADRSAGAQVNEQTPDGLYLYTADERRAAAAWFYQALYERAKAKAGTIGTLLTDAPDDIANQLVNTFASDWSDTAAKDSEAWKETGDANAVSPDNILLWDGPNLNGMYGHAAPLVYREPRYEVITVHKWKKVLTKGPLGGTVRFNGAPVAGALVQLYDGKSAFTDAAGVYHLSDVPFGDYVAKAAKDGQDGCLGYFGHPRGSRRCRARRAGRREW